MEENMTTEYKIDYTVLMIIFLLALISLIILSAIQPSLPTKLQSVHFVQKQTFWYIIGSTGTVLCLFFDYERYRHFGYYLYAIGMILLIGLDISISPQVLTINGATSWYSIPGIGNVQPSEFMKLFYIFASSIVLTQFRESLEEDELHFDAILKKEWMLIFKLTFLFLCPVLFLVRQPDLGMTMIYTSIFITYILISGIRWRLLLGLMTSILLIISSFIFLYLKFPNFFYQYGFHEYQLGRFYGWLDPHGHSDAYGYQLLQSLKAVGSGTLYGTGFGHVEVALPESHTDFIFAMAAEQFGFLGGSIIISLFFILIFRIVSIALQCNDTFGSFLCAGIVGMIGFQVFQNIGMTIGLLPITGLPLPFVSYGGSSLVTYMAAIGIVLNVYGKSKQYMFD
ncbi:FtsW/RodA/SpoVE family cell cycle protein [Sutcliffiella cohnii]|uniref:FtsW/RodA/SpoVE family cell cycle protein n=1 Tax=Sutcliffiella cohnii TaxID=33932 RepID=UPI002E1F8E80|nr:FtsW/RodA/SpoVE family cell cycle protein [Sutcliffiella cohnii]